MNEKEEEFKKKMDATVTRLKVDIHDYTNGPEDHFYICLSVIRQMVGSLGIDLYQSTQPESWEKVTKEVLLRVEKALETSRTTAVETMNGSVLTEALEISASEVRSEEE